MPIRAPFSLPLIIALAFLPLACNSNKPPSDSSPSAPGKTDTAAPASAAGAYFKDATPIPAKLKAKVGGPVRILELTLYPDHAEAQIQDPKKHENVDGYDLRNGQVEDPVPVQFAGTTPSAKDLDAGTLDIATVNFAVVPKIAADAVAQLKLEGGNATHMILKGGPPFNQEARWRVYVTGTRKSGSVAYDLSGSMKKVWN